MTDDSWIALRTTPEEVAEWRAASPYRAVSMGPMIAVDLVDGEVVASVDGVRVDDATRDEIVAAFGADLIADLVEEWS